MSAQPLTEPALFDADLRNALASLRAAGARPDAFGMSRALADAAARYEAVGALPSAEACLDAALVWARAGDSHDHLVDLLCASCEAAARRAEWDERQQRGSGSAARERARNLGFDAAILAGRVADRDWEARVLMRIGDVLERCGDHGRAAMLETRALRILKGGAATAALDPHLMPGLGRLADG